MHPRWKESGEKRCGAWNAFRAAVTVSVSKELRAHLEAFSIFIGLIRHVKQPWRGQRA